MSRTDDDVAPAVLPLKFFLIAFGFSWAVWSLAVAAAHGWIRAAWLADARTPILALGAFGPLMAALILTYQERGGAGVWRFLRRGLRYRIGLPVLAICLLLCPLLAGLAAYFNSLAGGMPVGWSISLPTLLALFLLLFFLGGSLQEEFGWAYAIDRMQARWPALPASILLGVLWCCWHLPLFFIPGAGQSFMPFWSFLIVTIAMRVTLVRIYNVTGRSILATLLFHTSFNLSPNLFPLLDYREHATQRTWIYFCLLFAVAAVPFAWQQRQRDRRPVAR